MSSLTSFESYFGNVFNSSIPKSRRNKKKKQNNKPKKNQINNKNAKKHKDNDNDIKMDSNKSNKQTPNNDNTPWLDFESNQNDANNVSHIKISSYKLHQSKIHRKNSINHKKNELQSNLISLGYNPKNMSLIKQRKLLDKAMKQLTAKKNENNDNKNDKKQDDILDFMKNNDLFIDKNKNNIKDKNIKTKSKQQREDKKCKDSLDLEFGDVIKPNFKREIDEERFIRTGKANKSISDRHLLKALKKRDKIIKTRYNDSRIIVDDHLANNAMKKLRGEKVKNDLKFMKNKLKQKYKKKVKSQRKWKQRISRKQYGRNKKLDRRDANITAYRQTKIAKRIGNRITTKQAIAAANI